MYGPGRETSRAAQANVSKQRLLEHTQTRHHISQTSVGPTIYDSVTLTREIFAGHKTISELNLYATDASFKDVPISLAQMHGVRCSISN